MVFIDEKLLIFVLYKNWWQAMYNTECMLSVGRSGLVICTVILYNEEQV